MFDYKALLEIQLSVDFLRVVQFQGVTTKRQRIQNKQMYDKHMDRDMTKQTK